MGIVVRQSIKSVIVTLFGVLLGGLVTWLSARFFPKAEYGFTQNLITIVTSISMFALLGFTSTILIIGQKYPIGHKARGSFLVICSIVPLLFSLLICACFFLFKEPILNLYSADDRVRMDEYFVLFPIFTLISVALVWMEGYLQSIDKVAVQSLAREVLFRVFYVALIILYGFNVIDYQHFIWIFVLIYLLPFIFLVFAAKKSGGFVFEYIKGTFSVKEIKELIRFSGYHMMAMVSIVLIYQFSPILLGPLSSNGLESVAVFGIATFVVAILRGPTRVMGVATMPTFSKTYQAGKIGELRSLFMRSSINMQLFGITAFALVYLNIDSIQEVMSLIQKGYGELEGIILILMIGQLADMISGFNYELIGITKYFRFNFWLAIFVLIIVFVLNFYLIKELDVYGAAWATSIGLVLYNILKIIFLWKKYKISPFNKTSFTILLIGCFAALITWIIPDLGNVFVNLAIKTLVFSSIFGFFVLRRKISPELNKMVHNLISERKLY